MHGDQQGFILASKPLGCVAMQGLAFRFGSSVLEGLWKSLLDKLGSGFGSGV